MTADGTADVEPVSRLKRYTWLQASKTGNGIGITIHKGNARVAATQDDDRHGDQEQDMPHIITAYVLPKMWRPLVRPDGGRGYARPFRLLEDGKTEEADPSAWQSDAFGRRTTTVLLFEGDFLALPKEPADQIAEAAKDEADAESVAGEEPDAKEPDAEASTEEGASDPLWSPSVFPKSATPYDWDAETIRDQEPWIDAFWTLIRQHPNAFPPNDWIAGATSFEDLQALRPLLIQYFLHRVDDELRSRKPRFVDTASELMTVRGHMPVHQLIQRKAHHRLPVWCEFDDLTTDEEMWQGIRQAVLACASDPELMRTPGDKDWERALDCDAQLQDVTIVPVAVILSQASNVAAAVKDRNLRNLYETAVAILRQETDIADPGAETNGVVASRKFVTSDLWENLVLDAVKAYLADCHHDGYECVGGATDKTDKTKIYPFTDEKFDDKNAKRPDIWVKRLDDKAVPAGLIIDGKYKDKYKYKDKGKDLQATFVEAGMSDQYQLYVYSNMLQAPAFLVYPISPSSELRTSMVTFVRANGTLNGESLKNAGWAVGVAALPFPDRGQVEIELTDQVKEVIKAMLEAKAPCQTIDVTPPL